MKQKQKEKIKTAAQKQNINPLYIILALAILARLIYFFQVNNFPFFNIPAGDEKAYVGAAKTILDGSLLAGKRVFYQDPFYPYFLSFFFALLGFNTTLIKLIQFALGAWLSVFIYKIGNKLFGEKTAFAAGIMYAVFPVFYFFEGQLLKSSLVVFFTVITFYLMLLYSEDEKPKRIFLAGIFTGLASIAQGQSYFFAAATLIWLLLAFRKSTIKETLKMPALFLAGVLMMIFPITLRNYIVGHDLVLTTYQAGTNFYIGNNDKSTGIYVPLIEGREVPPYEEIDAVLLAQKGAGRKLKPSEISAYWFGQGLKFIKNNPARWARLTAKKIVLYVNNLEAPDIADYYFVKDHSFLFRIPFFGFGTISALALISVLLLRQKPDRKMLLLYAYLAASFFSVVLFYVFSRYRLQGVPFALLLAAFSIVQIYSYIKEKKYKPLILALPLFVVFLYFGYYDTKATSPGLGYDINGQLYMERGNYEQAAKYFQAALAKKPNNVVIVYNLMTNLAGAYAKMGNITQSIAEDLKILQFLRENKADEKNERVYATKFAMGSAYMQARQFVNAQDIFEELKAVFPDKVEVRVSLGNSYKKLDKTRQAIEEFDYVLNVDTGNLVACNNIANIYRDQKKFAIAKKYYDRCLLIDPRNQVVNKNIQKLTEMEKK